MFTNIHIKGIATYHPDKKVKNNQYVEHFKQFGQDEHLQNLIDKVGRDVRTHAGKGETSISMSVMAAEKALQKSGLKPEDIDIIISSSDTPEYLVPSCAIIIRNQIKATNASVAFDMNSNCVGMINAMDMACRYLKTDKRYKRALIVGALVLTPLTKSDDMISSPLLGDGGAAIILESKVENVERGFIHSEMFTDDCLNDTIRFPACGLQNIANSEMDMLDRKLQWNPFDFSFLSRDWTNLIQKLVEFKEIEATDVKGYFMSQFSKEDIDTTMNNLGVDAKKAEFVADKYGYTGTTSPLMAFNDRLKVEEYKKNDYIVFCSVGAGYTMSAMLYKY